MKYLIIDEDPEIRKLIKDEICFKKDQVFECSDGGGALSAFAGYSPDYVIMDIRMKLGNGVGILKNIHEKFPSAKIIVVTELNTHPFKQAAFNAGAAAFYSKEDLIKVREFISGDGGPY